MGRVTKTIAGRMTIAVFVVNLIVLPVLYLVVVAIVSQSNEDQFVNFARAYSRYIGDSLERVAFDAPDQQVDDILDGFMLSGTGVTGEVKSEQFSSRGSIHPLVDGAAEPDDFSIGESGDDVYNISVSLTLRGLPATLRLGFDEKPILEKNAEAFRLSAWVMAIYWITVLVLMAIIGRRITRPIRALQVASRNVASGQVTERLTVESDLVEFVDLSNDLELMRSKLQGVNLQLQNEIRDRIKTEKARAILESQLQHKQRLETVGTLAGGIAHELNNILVPIILYSEMAIEDLDSDSPIKADVRRVLKAAHRAKLIVSQVLTFSRQIDDEQLEPIDIVDSILESLDLMRPAMPPDILLSRNIELESAIVMADKSSIGQLIINLLTNAYQAMVETKGTLDIQLSELHSKQPIVTFQAELPAGIYFLLSVSDSGKGIDADTIKRIFEPFYSTRQIGEGTGLGLSVVHGIVTSLHGGISVSSNLGAGSRFNVYLPRMIENSVA